MLRRFNSAFVACRTNMSRKTSDTVPDKLVVLGRHRDPERGVGAEPGVHRHAGRPFQRAEKLR